MHISLVVIALALLGCATCYDNNYEKVAENEWYMDSYTAEEEGKNTVKIKNFHFDKFHLFYLQKIKNTKMKKRHLLEMKSKKYYYYFFLTVVEFKRQTVMFLH